jgi:hypothetical protein
MARSLRRNAPLHMEVLEDRSVPAVISGYVFNDLNGNGLRDAGEQAIANNLIELRNSAGGLVGSTTTDSNGFTASMLTPPSARHHRVSFRILPLQMPIPTRFGRSRSTSLIRH